MATYSGANYDKIVIKSSLNRCGAAIRRSGRTRNPDPRLLDPLWRGSSVALSEVGEERFSPQPAKTDRAGSGGVGLGGKRGVEREWERQRRLHCWERESLVAGFGLKKKRVIDTVRVASWSPQQKERRRVQSFGTWDLGEEQSRRGVKGALIFGNNSNRFWCGGLLRFLRPVT